MRNRRQRKRSEIGRDRGESGWEERERSREQSRECRTRAAKICPPPAPHPADSPHDNPRPLLQRRRRAIRREPPLVPPAPPRRPGGAGRDRPLRNAQVADVGAGTGIATSLLHARGAKVTAVEPGDGMAAEFRRNNPGIPLVRGDGNHLPLATASADFITYAQAWHWTDPAKAGPEARRVLREGGALALLVEHVGQLAGVGGRPGRPPARLLPRHDSFRLPGPQRRGQAARRPSPLDRRPRPGLHGTQKSRTRARSPWPPTWRTWEATRRSWSWARRGRGSS